MSYHLPENPEDRIDVEAAAVSREIGSRSHESMQRWLNFVERYAITPATKDDAAVLQMLSQPGAETADQFDLLLRMTALLERIIQEHASQGSVEAREERARILIGLREHFQRQAPALAEVFRGAGICKRYTNTNFELGPLNLVLRLGEITGVVGQNAHGKTTLLRIVAGEVEAEKGSVEYPLLKQGRGRPINWPITKQSIAYVPQELPSWGGSLLDTLHYEAGLHGLRGIDNVRSVDFIVERLGLGRHLNKRWAHLSGGYKVRFALARALVWKPRLLVMDEPLANLDVKAKGVLLQDIRDLARSYSSPIAVILSSHDLHNLESVCNQMVFISEGQVRYVGDIKGVGANRDLNEFEIGTSLSLTEVANRLRESAVLGVREGGLNLLLHTARDVTPERLLQILLDQGIDLRYFRDNSVSIRSLFE